MKYQAPTFDVINQASDIIQGISGTRIDCDHTGRVLCEEPELPFED
jgi:hypothetical protein